MQSNMSLSLVKEIDLATISIRGYIKGCLEKYWLGLA